jgi:hypothetical protein
MLMLIAILVLLVQATPERIAAAIAHGHTVKGPTYILMGGVKAPHFRVEVTGPFGRIATAVAEADRLYRPFTAADVTPDMTAETFTITVLPGKPEMWREAPPIHHVVVRLKNGGKVIQPARLETFTATWPDMDYTAPALRATFSQADLLAAPDVTVVVISDKTEREYKLRRSDLEKVR